MATAVAKSPLQTTMAPAWSKDPGRIAAVEVPPLKQPVRLIDRKVTELEPRSSEARLVCECMSGVLSRDPHSQDEDRNGDCDLSDEEGGGLHAPNLALLGAEDFGERVDASKSKCDCGEMLRISTIKQPSRLRSFWEGGSGRCPGLLS